MNYEIKQNEPYIEAFKAQTGSNPVEMGYKKVIEFQTYYLFAKKEDTIKTVLKMRTMMIMSTIVLMALATALITCMTIIHPPMLISGIILLTGTIVAIAMIWFSDKGWKKLEADIFILKK